MARLTRQESQERTRRLLIESATTLFLRDGFRATSLEAIGEEAGFSRGAVYSNFSSKSEIGLAVVDDLYDRALRVAYDAVTAVSAEKPSVLVAALAKSMQGSIGDPSWARLEAELTAASTEGTLRKAVAERYAKLRAACSAVFVANSKARDVPLAADPELLGLAAFSVVIGLGMQRAADSTISGDLIEGALGLIVGSAFEAD